MTVEQAIKAYIQVQGYIHPSTSASTDVECTKNSGTFREEFTKVLKLLNMEADSIMQQATTEVSTGQT
jgi:hypothetical protein